MRPIVVGAVGVHSCRMVHLAIRCHPCVSVSTGDLEGWLERVGDNLQAEAGHRDGAAPEPERSEAVAR